MSKPKPCPECWVEAQRRELVVGADPDDTYREVLLFCPMVHDATQAPPVGQGLDRWARD